MSEDYEPASDFLKQVAAGSIPLSGSAFADSNLRKLIEFTSDDILSNRDWATFLLAQADVDTAEVRTVLQLRLNDDCEVVQEEAMVGLAIRKDLSVLQVLLNWMHGGGTSTMILEAAAEFGEPSLCHALSENRNAANELSLEKLWQEAWSKCRCTTTSA